jgi:uncharacterized protein (DUF1501 family)
LGWSGLGWLTPLSHHLARAAEAERDGARSLIVLWLAGGPSQLETFDPHAGTEIAAGTRAIPTAAPGIELASGLDQTAEQMASFSLIRNVISQEGDHERAAYAVKTGYRPDPTLTHPAIGAIICHQLPAGEVSIPRHVSILPDEWPARGGYLGSGLDAFQTGDPREPIPDMQARVSPERSRRRLESLSIVNSEFTRGRIPGLAEDRLRHEATVQRAVAMMSSEQLRAFEVGKLPLSERRPFGDTPFGRGCLAAARLIEVGVRCIEVTLGGWDTHINNHALHDRLKQTLDPALATLLAYLRERDLLSRTVVLVTGEFGRTPRLNPAGGRDHWPDGFSVAIAGGGIRGGQVVGQTDPAGNRLRPDQGTPVADIHATILHALGIDQRRELMTPVGRPLKLSEGKVIRRLRDS